MPRVDLHVVRERARWRLQSADGTTLAVFDDSETALAAACRRGKDLEAKGLVARIHFHPPGKSAQVFNYPAD
jgi:hypothetical protein